MKTLNALFVGIIATALAIPSLILFLWMSFIVDEETSFANVIRSTAATLTIISTGCLISLLMISMPVVTCFLQDRNQAISELKSKGYQVEQTYEGTSEMYIVHLNQWFYLKGNL